MSVWPSAPRKLFLRRRGLGAASGLDLLLVPFLGATLLVRVLTDDQSSPGSRHSGGLNLSGVIAVLFTLVAIGLLLRRRHGVLPAALASLWLCVWTAIAVGTRGASTETLREGVREGSIVALAVIVYNARGIVTVSVATRLVQLIGFAPALVALYELATHAGMDVAGNLRPHGTFAHPNSAAMFFAIAAATSLWRYLDSGRHRFDALLTTLFAAALIATFSIDGLATLAVMLVALGVLRPGSSRDRLGPCVLAGVIVLAFFATPLGSSRIAKESETNLATAEHGKANSTLGWRLQKWKTLLPEWKQAPLFGQGLGTTITEEGISAHEFAGNLPHNEYVRYLVETGVAGLMILLGALITLIRSLARKRRIPGTLEAGTLNAPSLAIVIVIGCLVDALADNTLLYSTACYAAALIITAVLVAPGFEMRRTRPLQTA